MRAFLARHRHKIGLLLTIAVFALAASACHYMLAEIGLESILKAVQEVPNSAKGKALLAAIASYCMLLGYEWSASRYAGVALPISRLALAGLPAAAIGNAVGFAMLTGGSVRYRFYSRYGVTAVNIVYMTVFASLSMGVALPPLASIMALFDLDSASAALRLPRTLLMMIALGVLAGYLALVLILRLFLLRTRPTAYSRLLGFGSWVIRVPGLRLTMLQFLITVMDVLAASTVLYVLLPVTVPYPAFITVYLLALSAGILSHVPGGVGVFEAVLLAAFGSQFSSSDQIAALAAALLFYRLIYVILPLLVACVVLVIAETANFFRNRRLNRY